MKKVAYILILAVVYLLFSGKSCTEEDSMSKDQETEVNEERENIRKEFGLPYLTEESRFAAEVAAIQKLNDLPDLLGVYSDTALDPEFRLKAGEMIRNTFVSEQVLLSFDPFSAELSGQIKLERLLQEGALENEFAATIRFDSVIVIDPLVRTDAGIYKGALGGRQQILPYGPGDTPPEAGNIYVEIYARRDVKVFGPDTLQVWEVLLGDMEARK